MTALFQDIALWLKSPHPFWARLPSTDEEAEEMFLANKQTKRQAIQEDTITAWPWILSTVVFASLAGILSILLLTGNRQGFAQACKPWRKTDLEYLKESATQELVEHEKRFNGALVYNETGNLVIESTEGEDKWVGNPTAEMDALWDRVESGSIVLLEGSEADMVRDQTLLYDGYWLTGLDVIHQVHCLNMIRKALYPEYYQPKQSAGVEMLHLEHCFDYIRQAIMCNSDITPVPLTWYQSAKTFGPDFRTTHTCRDFEALLQWSLKRNSTATKEKGAGTEHAKDRLMVMPGSLQGTNGLSHGDHHAH
ncbi:hypothetical protein N7524_008660 [Penicillium chrysogenum]|nr:hypothetical protein N7524_008660 [Penicillium chrysogenum]